MRMEDLDHPKDKPGAARMAKEDLEWLGFDWDDEYVQSQRKNIYREALDELVRKGLAYPCVCSRRDVASAQSAPHAGEQLFYPGTCRGRFSSWKEASDFLAPAGRVPCWRFRADPGTKVSFTDAFAGAQEMDVGAVLGDFPLARDEGGAGYTLAAVTDDLLMGVTEVVRGDDLLPATPAQLLVARALLPWARTRNPGAGVPSYFHVPLVTGPDGMRLAKRHGDTRVASFREAGWHPEEIIGFLAASCGWCASGERASLRKLIPAFCPEKIPHASFVVRNVV